MAIETNYGYIQIIDQFYREKNYRLYLLLKPVKSTPFQFAQLNTATAGT